MYYEQNVEEETLSFYNNQFNVFYFEASMTLSAIDS